MRSRLADKRIDHHSMGDVLTRRKSNVKNINKNLNIFTNVSPNPNNISQAKVIIDSVHKALDDLNYDWYQYYLFEIIKIAQHNYPVTPHDVHIEFG